MLVENEQFFGANDMNSYRLIMIFVLIVFSTNVLSYGSSSSRKVCLKPKFTNFTPPHLTQVVAESEFSFLSSSKTNPKSIVVSLKKQLVAVNIVKKNNGYLVSGRLPATLQSDFVRINIKAMSNNACKANAGWLLKIGANKPAK